MTKEYQRKKPGARDALGLAVPDRVSVVMADVAEDLREGLLALAVGAGLQVMSALMDAEVTALTGPRGRHDAERVAVRHGTGAGSVSLGGRRVGVQRPRVRAVDGSGELAVPAYELFSCTEILGRMAMERMLSGLSTRRYAVGLEPVGEVVADVADLVQLAAGHHGVVEHVDDGPVQRLGPVQDREDLGDVQATLAQPDAQLGDQRRVLRRALHQRQRVLHPVDVDPEGDHAA